MTYEKIKKFLQKGKIAMLPNYKGYFKWNWRTNQMYFINGDYVKSAGEAVIANFLYKRGSNLNLLKINQDY